MIPNVPSAGINFELFMLLYAYRPGTFYLKLAAHSWSQNYASCAGKIMLFSCYLSHSIYFLSPPKGAKT